jgi:hypothetical protein
MASAIGCSNLLVASVWAVKDSGEVKMAQEKIAEPPRLWNNGLF